MILGIFRRKTFFIDENVLYSMPNTILNNLAILVICNDNCNNLHRLLSIPTLPKYTIGSVLGHCLHVRVTCVCLFLVVCFCWGFFRVVILSFAKRPDRHDC